MKKWYYLVKGQKQGPLDGIHISEMVAADVISTETPIRAEHSADWVEFRESELAGGDTPCRTINHLGRIGRCYSSLKLLFLFNLATMFPVMLKIVSVYITNKEELKESPEMLYTLLSFAVDDNLGTDFWLILITAGAISFVILTILWGILLYRMWLVVPAASRKASPVILAAASALPVLAAFTNFWSVAGLSSRLTAQERREGVIGRRPSFSLCMVYCCTGILVIAMPQIFLLFHYFLWIGVAKQLHDASVSILHQRLQEI